VLEEAAAIATVPLIERIRFLSIYSSNLDEFYRVRMPVLKALKNIGKKSEARLMPMSRRIFCSRLPVQF
jgi:polyphosphate kinase